MVRIVARQCTIPGEPGRGCRQTLITIMVIRIGSRTMTTIQFKAIIDPTIRQRPDLGAVLPQSPLGIRLIRPAITAQLIGCRLRRKGSPSRSTTMVLVSVKARLIQHTSLSHLPWAHQATASTMVCTMVTVLTKAATATAPTTINSMTRRVEVLAQPLLLLSRTNNISRC